MYFKILCIFLVAVTFESLAVEAAIPTQMAAPVLKNSCSTSLNIAWAEGASSYGTGSVSYKLERDDGAGVWQSTAAYSGTALETTVTGLTASTTYLFRITPSNTDGSGPVSTVLSAATSAAAAPSKPENPLVVDSCDTSLTMEWKAPTTGCPTSYNLQIDAGDMAQTPVWDSAKSFTGSALTTQITGLGANKTYRMQLTATNAAGSSVASNLVYQSTTNTQTPSQPQSPVLESFDIKPSRTHSDTTTGVMTLRWEKGNRCGTTSKVEMDAGTLNGWNANRDSVLTFSTVVRTSDTVATITVPAIALYDTDSATETIKITQIPGTALSSKTAVTGSAGFKIVSKTTTNTAAASGTFVTGIITAAAVAGTGGSGTIILTLQGNTWDATIGSANAKTTALIQGIVSSCSTCGTTSFNNVRDAAIVAANVVRTSATVVTITVPQISTYATTADETITVTIPAAACATDNGAIVVGSTVVIHASSSSVGYSVSGTLVTSPRSQADIRVNSYTIIVTLSNDKWATNLGTNDASTFALIKSLFSGTYTQIYEGTGFSWLQGGLDSRYTYQFRVSHKNGNGYGTSSDPLLVRFPKLYMLVSDYKNDRVLRFDGVNGAYVDEFIKKGSGGLSKPWGIASGPTGDVFVAGENPAAVFRYDGKTGAFVSKFCDVPGSPRDIVFGPKNNWPSNKMPNVGAEITANLPQIGYGYGSVQWPQFGSKPINCPNGRVSRYQIENKMPYMSLDCLGHLYVTSHYNDAVLKFNGQTGATLGTFASGVDTPMGLFFDSDGHLRVASEHGDKVVKFNGVTGAYMQDFTNKNINYASGIDSMISSAGTGNLYVTGPYSGKVTGKFDATTGAYVEHFQDEGATYPVGLVQYNGNLYITNKDKVRQYNASTGEFVGVFATKDGMFGTFLTFKWM